VTRIHLSAPDVRDLERKRLETAVACGVDRSGRADLDAFAEEVASVTDVSYAVGLSSGTEALHLAMKELDVGPGDPLIVPAFTFAASANAACYLGAVPVFVHSDPVTWNLSHDLLAEELAIRAKAGVLPRAVVVDLYGQCADHPQIEPVLERYWIPIIEDAAEALGATCQGRTAGSFGRCGALSFNGNKIITTSAGGMLLCNDEDLASRVRHLATQAREPTPHYEHVEVGYNYRLSDLLAAFGRGQLATLADRIERRHNCCRRALADLPGVALKPLADYGEPNWWLICITIEEAAGFAPEQLRRHLAAADIEARPLWKPLHLQRVFADAPARINGTAERLFGTG
jgi:dTDP-4-amino-4,6-dideoxygalactose transaminase